MPALRWITDWRRRARCRRVVAGVNASDATLRAVSDDDLRRRSLSLRHRAKGGAEIATLLVEAFSLMREACRRTIGLHHFDVQIEAGAALCERTIVEMQTGEGKTLTAALPLYVFALFGRGACLATSNDYLATRDADRLRPPFSLLGLTVGAVQAESAPEQRRAAYRCDVTYGTGKEFGFDFLRDRLQSRSPNSGRTSAERGVQRPPYFMLVDEADSVLIDDAGTPLVLAAAGRLVDLVTQTRFVIAAESVNRFEPGVHFSEDQVARRFHLTAEGRSLVRQLRYPQEALHVGWQTLYEDLERAILARRNFHRDQQYVIREGAVEIVDEFTGRIAEGRKWRDGLHQAVEAQEGVAISTDGGVAARITVQKFFARFPHLAGMTGTAADSSREFRSFYRLPTYVVPTRRLSQRITMPTRIFATAGAKWQAIVAEIQAMHAADRPVLVGTRVIDQSQRLSELLQAAGVEHAVLNAREIEHEARIIAEAGRRNRVTVATNMAGRGTDIVLDHDVAAIGGLHVVLTEMHEAGRIDRQFIGRCGRQGDPGSCRIFLSLEDQLLTETRGSARRSTLATSTEELQGRYLSRFRVAQRAIESRNYQVRKQLLFYEEQRAKSAADLGLDPYLDLPE